MRVPAVPSVLAFFLLIPAAYAAGLGTSPSRVEVSIPVGGTATETIIVSTDARTAEEVSAKILDWNLSPAGGLTMLPVGESPHSASAWLSLASDSITVPASSEVPVRVSVHVPHDSKLRGTYHSLVLFRSTATAPKAGAQVGVRVASAVGVVFYVTIAGTEQNGSKLTDMYSDGSTVHAVVDNVGNTVMRYSGTLEVRDASGNTVNTVAIGDSAILRESERDIAVKMPDLPKGYYVLLLLLKDSRGGLLTGQLPYEVK